MANDLNQCNFIGRVGKIGTRYTNDGKAVTNISLACNESWKKDGQREEKCTWVPFVLFEPLAQIAEKYVNKGDKLYLSGSLMVRKWESKNGHDRYTTEIKGHNMQMLDSKKDKAKEYSFDDDIPF
jgi:single-strand DNA-binding protein